MHGNEKTCCGSGCCDMRDLSVVFWKLCELLLLGGYREETFPLSYFDIPVAEAVRFIEQDEVLSGKTTQMAQAGAYYLLGKAISPYELDIKVVEGKVGQKRRLGNYIFGALDPIEDSCNYIVRDDFVEYSETLRAAGFSEERYEGYSLFYKK